jgi:hypothetical protein
MQAVGREMGYLKVYMRDERRYMRLFGGGIHLCNRKISIKYNNQPGNASIHTNRHIQE